MQRVPITPAGKQQLEEELDQLKKVKRPNIIKAIDEARAHGDLKENAEYHAAKEQQSFIEGRISEIEGKLSTSQVIDITTITPSARVIFGTTVKLLNITEDKESSYKIVGEDEADINKGSISVNSPIARQLIAKEVGDVVSIKVPAGKIDYEILEVDYI